MAVYGALFTSSTLNQMVFESMTPLDEIGNGNLNGL